MSQDFLTYSFSDIARLSEIYGEKKKLAVLGFPASHSLSPIFQQASLDFFQIDGVYLRLEIRPEDLPEAISLLKEQNFVGCNLTLPHKTKVFPLCDSLHQYAKMAGAVNTLLFGEKIEGFNTDGIGFQADVENVFNKKLKKQTPLILGAGGAGAGILAQCLSVACEKIFISNRGLEKAEFLASELQKIRPETEIFLLEREKIADCIEEIDLVINTTSLGLNEKDVLPLDCNLLNPEKHFVYDLLYQKTPLIKECKKREIPHCNGLGMLIRQGRESFGIWFGKKPPLSLLKEAALAQ